MPRYVIEASKRTTFEFERVGTQVFDADDLLAAIKLVDTWLNRWGYTAPTISHARLICGDLIVAEKDATLSKWIRSGLYGY
jgi:hypothetical protein